MMAGTGAAGDIAPRPAADDLNPRIAEKLRQAAELLHQQGANPFRVGAYRRAADTIDRLEAGVADILEIQGLDGLVALPGIGDSIAAAIHEMARTGRWSLLERLRGSLDAERLFQSVPGIGPELARRIHDTLHVDTLEGLEAAAYDGRLAGVPGIGPRRVAALRAALTGMLGRVRAIRLQRPLTPHAAPGVDIVLDVDAKYRDKAAAGRLETIAPRRFNPEGKAWLPILHTERGDWHFTALFSNTARAHELGRTRDWVVIYFYDGDHREGQHTVVTETRGPLIGRRVVRGREAECRGYYGSA
jgi:putative hydrolase